MGRRIGLVIAGSLIVAGCGTVQPPSPPAIGTSVEVSSAGGNTGFVVTPWPLDATTAFLCVNKPGAEFTVESPVPAATARCVPLSVSVADDRLSATFDRRSLTPDQAGRFRLERPAYLAVAGSRGALSAATILTVAFMSSASASPG
jgi:hypothetical protein